MTLGYLSARRSRATARARRDAGVTLVELLVALAVLGVIAGVGGLALARVEPAPPDDALAVALARARREAIASGTAVSITVGAVPVDATALPDGSVVADSAAGVERLLGRRTHVRP